MTSPSDLRSTDRSARILLALAAVAVGFAAVDTYVVVLALPEMMTTAEVDVSDLQKGAPIVSGFLLGYVAVLPLIGRISDLRGRIPVLVGSLVVFGVGSLITAAASDLTPMVIGRLIQGIGGGGLIPPTLALVADLWPPARRGFPLGVIGAVQELGSVLGPLYGALVLSVGTWRDIFWLNAAVGFVLMAALIAAPKADAVVESDTPRRSIDWLGLILATLTMASLCLTMLAPRALVEGITTGLAYLPVAGTSRLLEPITLATFALAAAFVASQVMQKQPLLDWRSWGDVARATDIWGAVFISIALGVIVVMFASANPETETLPTDSLWLIPIGLLAIIAFVRRQKSATHPLIPRGTFAAKPAWGSLIASFFIGSALIAALVDIPLFARLTTEPDSQTGAALVLVRFLIALPVGAILGGLLLRRLAPGPLTAGSLVLTAVGFLLMTTWDATTLESPISTIPLVLTGLGFGLAIAPVNAALLAFTDDAAHGVASALLIVFRTVGMLVGISVLTSVGLRVFFELSRRVPSVEDLCGGPATCPAYRDAMQGAGITQVHAVFIGAAICALIAAVIAVATLPMRSESTSSD